MVQMEGQTVSALTLSTGEEGIIADVSGGIALAGRLAAMGIAPNTKIRMLQNSGGRVIVQVADTRVALGRGEAERISIYRLPGGLEEAGQEKQRQRILVALAGPPNVGKSTVFNILTGLSQHVGNWPGKTVEKKEGIHLRDDTELHIVDLPGTYSLTAFSEDERVARDFIFSADPNVIVLIASASALERSLYLLSELLLLGPPVIMAVNMVDVAETQGIHIDFRALEASLGIPVIPMVATKNRGIKELVKEITAVLQKEAHYSPQLPEVLPDHSAIFARLTRLINDYVQPPYAVHWVATKLMEGDSEITKLMEEKSPSAVWSEIQSLLVKHEDSLHAVVGGRYDWIEEVTRASVSRFRRGQVLMTDRIDHVLTRPLFGIPILLGFFALVFAVTYGVGLPLQSALQMLVRWMSAQWLAPALAGAPGWIRGVITDGVIGGAGYILTFLPILLIFFAVMAVMEDVGYLARAAFVMDRFMHLVGLHGKSFIPMCLGFGCNVPAIMAARIVESKKERLITIFLTPFIPCTARLAVLVFVSAAVFGEWAAVISWSLLTLNIVILGIVGMLINRLLLKEEPMPFIMELPLYHKPDLRTIGAVVWHRTVSFVKIAGSVILVVSVLVWLLSYLPYGRVEDSILATIGRTLEPAGRLIGLDWKMITALITSLIQKENAVATLGVLYGVGAKGLAQVLPEVMNHASALSFLVVLMLFMPCAATVATMKREMGNWKWFLASFFLMLAISFSAGAVAYRLALWAGF